MGLKSVSPTAVLDLLERGAATVIDVNASSRWAKAHVPGAVNLDPERFEAGDLPADPGTTLVFYCSNPLCRKAPNAARRAKRMGYRDARVMSAGIEGWLAAALPIETAQAT
jgi:rhodanese-related sulfurtransferase